MNNRNSILISFLLIMLCSACTKKASTVSGASFRKGEVPTDITDASAHYDFKEAKSSYGVFQLYTLTNESLKKISERLKDAHLKPLNLEREFGITAYHVEGYEIPRTVLIVPKIIFRSSINGLRPRLQDEGGGVVSMQTQFALTDGTVDTISSGAGGRLLATGFKIKDPSALLDHLKTVLGGAPNFLSNIQCPETVSIHDAQQGFFKVEMQTPMKSCPTNVFLPTKVTFTRDAYDNFRENFINKGQLSVVTDFSFGTPVTLNYGKFILNREKLDSLIQANFVDSGKWYSFDDINSGLKKIVDTIQKSVEQCIPQEPFAPLKDKVIESYFETKIQPDCPSDLRICFKRKLVDQSVTTIDFSLRREDYLGSRTKYESESYLSDTLSEKSPILLKQDNPDLLKKPSAGTINNALRTVQEGDWVELAIQRFKQSTYEFSTPQVQNISNNVCLSPYKMCLAGQWSCTNPNSENYNCRQDCTGGWDRNICLRGNGCVCVQTGDRCRSYSQVCDQRHVCDRLTAPSLPEIPFRMDKVQPTAPDFAWNCTNQTDSKCDPDQWQDQWQRITKYSNPILQADLNEKVINLSDLGTMIDGLTLVFSNGVQCPLSALNPRTISSSRVLFQVQNNSICKIFGDEDRKAYHSPNLSIINGIRFEQAFKCGELWEDFKGDRKYSCLLPDGTTQSLESSVANDDELYRTNNKLGIWIPFYPRSEVEAQLRFVGGYFETEPEELRK